jgi:hypothetical protein
MVIRLPYAFNYHNRRAELTWIMHPIITALAKSEKFAGSIDPWTGFEGESDNFKEVCKEVCP